MLRSLYTGISGLLGNQQKLDVVGNNIANASTVGFKRSRVNFQESFSETLRHASEPSDNVAGKVPMQVGLGTRVASIDRIFEQGNLELTGNSTDLAVYGEGFFLVNDGVSTYYTRNGAFQIDAQGSLVTASGHQVQGLRADAGGVLPALSEIGSVVLPLGQKDEAVATTEVSFQSNLDAAGTISVASLVDQDNDAGVTSVSGTAVDGVGGTYEVTVTGEAATRSEFTGGNLAFPGALEETMTLGELGVTLFGELSLSVDGGDALTISDLGAETTLAELMAQVEAQSSGVELSIVGGELQLARTTFGDGAQYNVTLSEDPGISDVLNQLFGLNAVTADDGVDSTLAATAVLTTTRGQVLPAVELSMGAVDPLTGQVTQIDDLGGGGVSVFAADGLSAGTFSVLTADTVHETSIVVYDSLGESHTLTVDFTRSETANEWIWEAELPAPATDLAGNSGRVTFNEDGSLASWTFDNGSSFLSFDPGNGEMVQIAFDPGTPGLLDGITQTSADFSTRALEQNGRPMGLLDSVEFMDDGRIQGVYSNGSTKVLAQILVAEFNNAQGLSAVGASNYVSTGASGAPIIGMAGTDVNSVIKSGYLEMSNTDLTSEFTEMIIAQRGFQASAKVISTSDQLLDEAIRLKR